MTKYAIIILLAILLFVGAVVTFKDKVSSESATKKEEPKAAVLKSGVHLKAMDTSTKAADDFYQYTNGGWLDNTEIPGMYSGYTVYHEVNERVDVALREIIQQASDSVSEPGSEAQKVGDLFRSYMDVEKINQTGLKAIDYELNIVKSISDTSTLTKAFAEFNRIGIRIPFYLYVAPDLKNSTVNTPYMGQSGITLSNRDYYLDLDNKNFDKARNALPIYIKDILVATGKSEADAVIAAKNIVALETSIATAQWDNVKNRDTEATYNPTPFADLSKMGSNFDWVVARTVLGLNAGDKIIIVQPSYFESLDKLLTEVSIDTWKDYMTYKVMDSRAHHLDEKTAAIRFDFRNRTLSGQQEPRPRWKRGVSLINSLVGEAVGKLYVEEYFPAEAKAKMMELVDNVIQTLDGSIDELDWMSAVTKVKAKEKLSKFTPKIGYPDVWTDYSTLEVINGDHLANLRNALNWAHTKEVSKLGNPVDRTEWQMNPQTVNAYYDPTKNEIVFPAARLQPPFFQLDADDAINYGAVGGVIGHEISHGFDDQGSRFDGDGNLVDWWTEEDRAGFEKKTKALIEQYSQFSPIEGMTVNGAFTLGENIGDLSGVAMAYRAYIESLNGEQAPVIDGLTGAQRFFIGYAMSRKGKYKDETTISRLASDPHSPLKYRVIGPYRNIDAFHAAFGTKEGDGMWLAPEDRVRIW
jgi:putative endopeptidase